ncbi:MAG: hypothetical protein WA419_09090 [Silvibacterium sp.]
MKTQRHAEHPRPEADMVVNPVRRAAVMMQPGHMSAYPDTDIR